MKRLRSFTLLLFSAVLLAACNQDVQPPVASTAPSFSFAVDPASGSAKLQTLNAQDLEALQTDTCEAGVRTLIPGQELAVDYEVAFLPGNILEITASFQNVTTSTYQHPFSFYQDSKATSNIVSSTEPTVSDDDLGGDGALSPLQTTSELTFTVEHMGQPFTYGVFAQANVICPTAPSPNATLTLTKTDGDVTVSPGDTIVYTLSYANGSDFASSPATLSETVPENTTFNGESSEQGWSCADASTPGTVCTLDVGILGAIDTDSSGGTALFAVTVDAPLAEGVTQISNTASITDGDTADATARDSAHVCTEAVTIPDDGLRAAIRETLNKQQGDTITCADMENLTILQASFRNISDLTGLDYAVNLQELYLYYNQISDIAVFQNLTRLNVLHIGSNRISDFTVLQRLTNLSYLDLYQSRISDISMLVNNPGLGTGDFLSVVNNCLNSIQAQQDIQTLRDRGVDIHDSGQDSCAPN